MWTLIAMLVALQSSAWRDNINLNGWLWHGASADGRAVMLYRAPTGNRVWVRFEADPQIEDRVPSSVNLFEVNCSSGTYLVIQGTSYERPNLMGASTAQQRSYSPEFPVPGSFGETAYQLVCEPWMLAPVESQAGSIPNPPAGFVVEGGLQSMSDEEIIRRLKDTARPSPKQ